MNQLRQLMLEELRRRNFADTTIRSYLHGVEHFSRYFRRRPDQLGPEDIRKYQAMLFTQLKFSPNTVILRLAALRFFYIHVLKRGWSIAETPYPKKVRHLPQVLSQEEVARLIDAAESPFHRILLMTLYATGARRAEAAHLKIGDVDSQRMVVHVRGARRLGPRRHAEPEASRSAAHLLARAQTQADRVAVSRQPMAYRKLSRHHQSPLDCLSAGRRTCRPCPKAYPSSYASTLFCHTPTRSRRRPAHYPDAARASRP